MTSREVFVTEGNVDIYLSKLHTTWDEGQRDSLLRLVIAEEARMGLSREHVEYGERRVDDGHKRLARQRELVAQMTSADPTTAPERQLLVTLEKTQALLELHLEMLKKRAKQAQL